MTRLLCSLVLVLWTSLCLAQADTSLTREFSQLSAKERAKIAKQEQEESVKDERYQAVMAQAEDLFQRQEYEGSLVRFKEARIIRPYNVYPKVKIQDLQALIAKRDIERTARPDTAEQVAEVRSEEVLPVLVEQPRVPPPVHVAPPVADPKAEAHTEVRPLTEKPRPVPHPNDTIRTAAPPVEVAPKAPDGTTERTYKEGRAIVIERQVVTDGRTVLYKKVTHPWGETVHFKDGIAIPARVWDEAFGDK